MPAVEPIVYTPDYLPPAGAALRAERIEIERRARAFNLDPAAYSLPGPRDQTLAAGAGVEVRLTVPVGTYILGFTASSSHADGFTVEIIDTRHNSKFWQRPINHDLLAGASLSLAGNTYTYRRAHLPEPRLVIEPGLLIVRLKNKAAATNTVQLVIFTAEPRK